MLVHDTVLNKDSYRTGTSDTGLCECGEDEETVVHMLFHCSRHSHVRTQLNFTLDDFCISTKNSWSACDKTRILLAPPFEDNISKRDNLIKKDALSASLTLTLTGNYEDILLLIATYFHYFLNQLQQTLISPLFMWCFYK